MLGALRVPARRAWSLVLGAVVLLVPGAARAAAAPSICAVSLLNGGAAVPVLATGQLAPLVGGSVSLASARLNTVPAPAPGASGPGADAPGSAASCIWIGSPVRPVAPYFFKTTVNVVLSVVPYPSAADARLGYNDQAKQNRAFAGSASIPPVSGVGDAAFLASPGPQDENAILVLLTGRYVVSVSVSAVAAIFRTSPWLAIGRAVAANLSGVAAPSVTAFPLQAIRGRVVNTRLAYFSYPTQAGTAVPAGRFTATIDWGDGTSSRVSVSAASASSDRLLKGTAGYLVGGRHRYRALLRVGKLTVTVEPPAGPAGSGTSIVTVVPLDPVAAFVVNPPAGVQDGISLMMPQAPAPGQRAIVARSWVFLDDYNPVVDSPQTQPIYRSLVAALVANPGDEITRAEAVSFGILPTDQGGGPFGFAGLSDKDVTQIARVWAAYFPSHIVPHLYDEYGQAGVGLTTLDSAGVTSTADENVSISRDCLKWGGPISGLFGNYTVCDTYDGIAAQFGPHRLPDWIGLDISNELGSYKGLGFGGGLSIVITRAVLSHPSQSVFVSLHLDAGVGLSLGGSLAAGWVGLPDPKDAPLPDTQINDFVSGFTADGGFSVGAPVLGVDLGLGFQAIYSPNADASKAGEQIFAGVVGLSASAGISCSWPLASLPPSVLAEIRHIWNDFGESSGQPSELAILGSAVNLADSLVANHVDVLAPVLQGIASCAP